MGEEPSDKPVQPEEDWVAAFYKHGGGLVKKLSATPSAEILAEYFRARTAHWKHSYVIGEGTTDTFDDLCLLPPAAFQLVGAAADILLSQEDPALAVTAGTLLWRIVELSATTDMPKELEERWGSVVANLEAIKAIPEATDASLTLECLRRWYRKRS